MKLYLVQHAEACSKDSNPDRPLTEKGKTDANRMAVFLRQANVRVDRVIHSGKLRAQQTTDRMMNAIAKDCSAEVAQGIGPNDDPAPVLQQALTWKQDTLIISHMPFLGRLVTQLLMRDNKSFSIEFTPGTIVCLQRTEDYRWVIDWVIKPELL